MTALHDEKNIKCPSRFEEIIRKEGFAIASAVIAGGAGLYILTGNTLSTELAYSLLLGSVSTLSLNEIVKKYNEKKTNNIITEIQESVKEIKTFVNELKDNYVIDSINEIKESTGSKVIVPIRSSDLADPVLYNELWGGFSGTHYYAFNPAYAIELSDDGSLHDEKIVNVFIDRYFGEKKVRKARYIFLTKDKTDTNGKIDVGSGTKDLIQFRKFMDHVRRTHPDIEKRIEIKQNKTKTPNSHGEFYVGIQRDHPACIVEPIGSALGQRRGKPTYYLRTTNTSIVGLYEEMFEREWDSLDSELVKNFWTFTDPKELQSNNS